MSLFDDDQPKKKTEHEAPQVGEPFGRRKPFPVSAGWNGSAL